MDFHKSAIYILAMKKILPFLLIAISCSNHPGDKFDTLPIPADSATFYFSMKPDWRDTTTQDVVDSFTNTWYSKMLYALHEPVLKDYRGEKEIYRFTWLRSFHHPAVVRVEKQGGIIRLFSKVCDGAGGYEPEKIIFNNTRNLTQKETDRINHYLDAALFWTLKTENNERGTDGAEWIIEVCKDNRYHMVARWSPGDEPFRRAGDYFLSISGIKNETEVY